MSDKELSIHDKCPICGRHFDCGEYSLDGCGDYSDCDGCPIEETGEIDRLCECESKDYIFKIKDLTSLYDIEKHNSYTLIYENQMLRRINMDLKDVNKHIRNRLSKHDTNKQS